MLGGGVVAGGRVPLPEPLDEQPAIIPSTHAHASAIIAGARRVEFVRFIVFLLVDRTGAEL
ncbi:hypothetical protein GCM10009078_16020 [Cupriavidus gilardii]